MILHLSIIILLLSLSFCAIQEQTFRDFFRLTFDLDRDEKFNLTDWKAYFKYIQPEININSSHLKQTFDIYDQNGDQIVTLHQMMKFAQPIQFQLSSKPKQIHIGFTDHDGEMQVMWITSPNRYKSPCVKYGLNPKQLNNTVNATYTTYNQGKFGFHGRIYKSVMTKLNQRQKYYYKVGDCKLFQWSQIRNFTSPPNKGQKLDRIHFSVFGDMGTYAPMGHFVNQALFDYNSNKLLDFVFLNGDIAYAGMNSEKVGEVQPIWDLFGQQTEKWASFVPFMPGVGNHQKYYNYTAYQNRYYLPRSPGSGENFWFSFDYAQIRLIHISSQHDYHEGSPQYVFLESRLKDARSNGFTQWIIVAAHRTFYSSDSDAYQQIRPLAVHLQDLMNQYNVDIIQTGHQHNYERSWPLYKKNPIFAGANYTHYVKPQTPIYIVQGTAGALIKQQLINPAPAWSLRRENKYGFGVIQIKGNTLKYQFISVKGNVIDEWFLIK